MVHKVGYVDVARGSYGHSCCAVELPISCSLATPCADKAWGNWWRHLELLDATVALVSYVDVARGVYGHSYRAVELPISCSRATPLEDKGGTGGELLDAVVSVSYVYVVREAYGHSLREAELPISCSK